MLTDCVQSLGMQAMRDFEIIIVDNSGKGLVRRSPAARVGVKILEEDHNAGFGAAINRAYRASTAPFLATLNDDAAAHRGWLGELVRAIHRRPDVGMCASQVRIY